MTAKDARVLIIGGGFGGLFTALDLVGAGAITLINDEDHFLFKPMLYEYLSGEVEAWHIAPECKELLDERVRFAQGKVTDIDLDARAVTVTARGEPSSYDAQVFEPEYETNYAYLQALHHYHLPFRNFNDANRL